MAVLALLLSISWVDFQAANGHPWQTEQFSALFAIAYAFLLVSAKHSWWHTTLLAISLLGAIGFKEPFLISCLAAALLVDARPSALKQNFLVPLGIAAILGMIIMALTGTLLPYLTYDLPMVFGFRLTGFADPLWMRFLGTHKILLRFERAAPLLPIVAVATSIALAWFNWKTSPKPSALLRATGVTILIIVLGTFSVGIGGDFQDHHFAVLTPLAAALIFLVLKNCIKQHKTKRAHLMCILLLLVSSISILLTSPKINWSALQSQKEEEQKLRSVAAGVDTVLDHCNVDRYLYIHPTGKLRLDGFTAHSPINHALFMSIDNAFQNGQTFLDESLLRLSLAKIIVLSTDGFTPNNDIGDVIAKYMLTTFTASPPDCALPLPEIPGFFLAFRTKDQPLDLQINMEY